MPESRIRRKQPFTPPPVSRDPVKFESPRWLAPAMVTAFVLGLIWVVVFYIAGNEIPGMRSLGAWNIVVGFGLIGIGFGLSTRWR